MSGQKLILCCVGFGVLAVALSGCAQKLTRERFDMISIGHAERFDVEHTLGEPDYSLDDYWHYEDVDRHLNVMIHFDDAGKVWRKEWHDVGEGIHYDTYEPDPDEAFYESTEIRTYE